MLQKTLGLAQCGEGETMVIRQMNAAISQVGGRLMRLERFGLLHTRREESVFELHPAAKRVWLLLMAYDKNARGPFGFHPRSRAEALAKENEDIAVYLLSDIAEPGFTPQDANAMLTRIQEKRPALLDELPKDIYQTLLKKAQTTPADTNGRVTTVPVMVGRSPAGGLILMNPFAGVSSRNISKNS